MKIINLLRFTVPTAATVKATAFRNVAQKNLVEVDRRFRRTYCLLHGTKSQKAVIFIINHQLNC
jgi:hypothetical protein